jgi:hypothetical protein
MTSNSTEAIVMTEDHAHGLLHGLAVRHRDFPEVRGEGESAADAAARLADILTRTLDSAPSDWRRENIQRALEDIRAFAERGG